MERAIVYCVLIECERCGQVALVGIVVGSLLFGWLTDRIGRQFPLQIGAVVGLLSAFGSSIAPSYSWLLAARFIVGISLGGIPQVYGSLLPLRPHFYSTCMNAVCALVLLVQVLEK